MFRRPSMPPNSPTTKSPNGSEGTAARPMSEQPATVSRTAAISIASRPQRSLPGLTTTPSRTDQPPGFLLAIGSTEVLLLDQRPQHELHHSAVAVIVSL